MPANVEPALRRAGINEFSAGTSASKRTKNLKIKLQKMKKKLSVGTNDEHRTAADDSTSASLVQNGLLAAGFKNFNEQMRFAKILSIATIYQQDPEWEDAVKITVKMNCNQEARRLKFPDGWQSCGSYSALKEWFISACR